jgi:hypothetical protein
VPVDEFLIMINFCKRWHGVGAVGTMLTNILGTRAWSFHLVKNSCKHRWMTQLCMRRTPKVAHYYEQVSQENYTRIMYIVSPT